MERIGHENKYAMFVSEIEEEWIRIHVEDRGNMRSEPDPSAKIEPIWKSSSFIDLQVFFNIGSIEDKLSFLHGANAIDSDFHSIHFFGYKKLAGHSRCFFVIVLCCQQNVKLLLWRIWQFLIKGLDIYSACGAGELFIAESEDISILIDGAVGHIHEIITWVCGCLPTRHWMGVCCLPLRTKIVMVLELGLTKLFSSFPNIV